MFLDLFIQEYEREVEHIVHLNQLAHKLPSSFNNATNLTKSHIHVANALARLGRPAIQTSSMKKGRGEDLQSHKLRTQTEVCAACEDVLPSIKMDDNERETPIDSTKIAINFMKAWKLWDRTKVNLNDAFCYYVSQYLDNDCDPTTITKTHS